MRSASSTGRLGGRFVQLASILAVSVVGCGTGAGENEAAPTTTENAPASTAITSARTESARPGDAGTDWCPSSDDVGKVVGQQVSEAVTGGREGFDQLTFSYGGCSYGSADNDYSITRIALDPKGNGSTFDLLDQDAQAALVTSGFIPVEGLGDDAYLDGQTLVVRNGDSMVLLDAEPDDGKQEGVASRRDRLAEDLVAIDLSDDETLCTAPADAVEDAFGPSSSTGISHGGASIDEVDIEHASCTFEAADGTEVSVRVADAASWDGWVAAKRASPLTASHEALSIGGHAAFDTGTELIVDDDAQPLRIDTRWTDLGGDEARALRVKLAELVLAR